MHKFKMFYTSNKNSTAKKKLKILSTSNSFSNKKFSQFKTTNGNRLKSIFDELISYTSQKTK